MLQEHSGDSEPLRTDQPLATEPRINGNITILRLLESKSKIKRKKEAIT